LYVIFEAHAIKKDSMSDPVEIYLDHIAASRVRPEAVEAMVRVLNEGMGNPHSVHSWGQRSAEILAEARESVAGLVGSQEEEVIFTATGSEANNLAIKGIARARKKKSNRVIISAIEHLSVINAAKTLKKEGFEVVTLPVDSHGMVDAGDLKDELKGGAAVVSIIHASTEIGTIEPIEELAGVCNEAGVPLHTDAWGSAGMIPLNFAESELSAMTIAAQNFQGPPGAAALILKKGVTARALIDGGIQERGYRAGQENIPAIAGMGVAAGLAAAELGEKAERLSGIRDELIRRITSEIDDVILTGHPEHRLPNHASFCVKYIEGEGLLLFLNQYGIMAASGSACTSKSLKASHVLSAIGLDAATAQGSLVMTLGPENNLEEVEYIVESMKPIVKRLREMSPLYKKKEE